MLFIPSHVCRLSTVRSASASNRHKQNSWRPRGSLVSLSSLTAHSETVSSLAPFQCSRITPSRGVFALHCLGSVENMKQNVAVVDKITEIAKTKGATTAQLALAWLLAQGDDIFAIPGTTKDPPSGGESGRYADRSSSRGGKVYSGVVADCCWRPIPGIYRIRIW